MQLQASLLLQTDIYLVHCSIGALEESDHALALRYLTEAEPIAMAASKVWAAWWLE